MSFLSVIKLNNDVYPEENRRRAALHCFSSRFNLFKQKRCHGTLAQRPELTKPEDNGLRPCDLQRLVPLQRPVRENLAFDEGKRGFPEQKRGRSGRKDTRNELLPVKTEVSPEREHGKNELYPEPLMNLKTLAQQPKEGSLA